MTNPFSNNGHKKPETGKYPPDLLKKTRENYIQKVKETIKKQPKQPKKGG